MQIPPSQVVLSNVKLAIKPNQDSYYVRNNYKETNGMFSMKMVTKSKNAFQKNMEGWHNHQNMNDADEIVPFVPPTHLLV